MILTPNNDYSHPEEPSTTDKTTVPLHGLCKPLTNVTTTPQEIIPREVLFGNPKYSCPELSPDGTYISFLAPSQDNVLNVFVKRTTEPFENAKMATHDTKRDISHVIWAQDSQTILYLQDHEGDENYHLYAVHVSEPNSRARDLTPGGNVQARDVVTNRRYPDEILVSTNQRDPRVFDVYRCNYKTGDMTMDTQNPGDVVGWRAEELSFEIRMAEARNQEDGSATIRVRDSAKSEWRDLIAFPFGEYGLFVDFDDSGKTCYLTSSLDRETTALLQVDLHTGETVKEIFSNDKCDCGEVIVDNKTKKIRAVSYNYARVEHKFFDQDLEKDYAILKDLAHGDVEVVCSSRTNDEKLWIVTFVRADGPTEFVLYDQQKKVARSLFVDNPDFLKYKFAPREDVRIQARDGLELVAYLTRARVDQATPMVLFVHGGPSSRDEWEFDPRAQWFANRGYATLQVNFRGSTGYGKTFLHMGDAQWGVGDMQHDLTDSVHWAIDQGIAIKDKICIYGGSYGGYACLAGLAFTPDLYACGVDVVGPSNVKTLLESIPPYWEPLRKELRMLAGDVDIDEEFNKKVSPFFHVEKIKAPLLIGQGKNDPRVKQSESDQVAFAMHDKGIPVEYILYPDEGHGFMRPDNRIDFNGRVELFLKKHLGGRAEAFQKPEKATAQFPLETRARNKI